LPGSTAIALRAPVPGDEQSGVEPAMLEAAAVRASIRQLRERARAPCRGAFTQRQRRRVLRQEAVALQELRGSTGSEARPNLDGAESTAFLGSAVLGARRRLRAGYGRATREEPIRRTRQSHERADQREKHAAVLPKESSIQQNLSQAPDRTR
jgi:hypothetical protein